MEKENKEKLTGDEENKEKKEEQEKLEEQEKCWICKRGFVEALEEFNKKVLSNKYIDDDVKSRYEKGKKEFFPLTADYFVEFILANVEGNSYSMSVDKIGDALIWLCPVCSGLLESFKKDIETGNFLTREDLEDVSIVFKD